MDTQPTYGQRVEAERLVADIAEQGAFHWRAAGTPAGELAKYQDAELREALVEALARNEPLDAYVRGVKDEIEEAQRTIGYLGSADLEVAKLLARLAATNLDKFAEHAADLVKSLVETIDSKSEEIERLKTDAEERVKAEPTPEIRIVRPAAKSPKAKLGSTTLPLPFLLSEVEVVVREVVQSSPAPVRVSEDKPKRGRPTGSKSAPKDKKAA